MKPSRVSVPHSLPAVWTSLFVNAASLGFIFLGFPNFSYFCLACMLFVLLKLCLFGPWVSNLEKKLDRHSSFALTLEMSSSWTSTLYGLYQVSFILICQNL